MGKKYLDTKGGTLESSVLDVWKQAIAVTETNKNDKSDDGEGLDAVQPKAVKKKFKDRKDKDIDNDGDTDSSDKYLHKRRKAVSKAIATEARQLKDKKKEMMVSLKGNVKVIDKSDWPMFKKKGYVQAEETEAELDEAILKDRDYEVDHKAGVVKISKKNFAKVHKDSKGTDKSKPTMMVLTKKGTSLYPVKFTEEVDLDEDASNFKSAVARIKKATSAKDLKKLEKSFERVYKQTGALTDKEFGQLDDMISDKLVKLGEEVELEEHKGEKPHAHPHVKAIEEYITKEGARKKVKGGDGRMDEGGMKRGKDLKTFKPKPKKEEVDLEKNAEEYTKTSYFTVQSMRERLHQVWNEAKEEFPDDKDDEKKNKGKKSKTDTGKDAAVIDVKPEIKERKK